MKNAWLLLFSVCALVGCFKDQAPAKKVHFEVPLGSVIGICNEIEERTNGACLKKCVAVSQDGIPVFTIDELCHAANILVIEDKPEQK